MIIVLEGCDGSGKSTLAKKLSERYGLKLHHEGPPPKDVEPLEHYGGLLESHRWAIHRGSIKGVVFDRLAFGERVYGPIFRDDYRFDGAQWTIFKRLLTASNAIHVFCWAPFSTILENWKKREGNDMVKNKEQLRVIYDTYVSLVSNDSNFHTLYNYAKTEIFSIIYNSRLQWKPLHPGVIGSPCARYLFVGEKGSQPTSATADLPFFGMVNSSGFLNDSLVKAGYNETELAFTNAFRWDNLQVEWPKVGRTIALGGSAQHECQRRGQYDVMIPHPQYWKRFKASDTDAYIRMLRQVRI